MNVLLILLPLAVVSHARAWPAGATFLLSLLPLCSLAERLGLITEQLALFTNDTLGGLLNATFGNATEVIIAAFAIKKGFLRVVQLTLLGSIISNLLLVMGSAFVAGGVFHPHQSFNQQGINVNCALLILSVISIALPTLLSSTAETVKDFRAELALSRFESLLMLLAYGLFLVFQLVTHRHLYDAPPDAAAAAAVTRSSSRHADHNGSTSCVADEEEPAAFEQALPLSRGAHPPQRSGAGREVELAGGSLQHGWGSGSLGPAGAGLGAVAGAAANGDHLRLIPEEAAVQVLEEEEQQVLSFAGCFIWLTLVTVGISFLSDYIMDAITEASQQLHIPLPFLTAIVVPIVGNAAEHASALIFAVRNRMEISLGVAMGSSTQVGVLVVPFCIVLAWCVGQPLDLNFNEFEAVVLFISVLLAVVVVQDGTANWLKGAMLVFTYFFIAAGFWVHKDPKLQRVEGLR